MSKPMLIFNPKFTAFNNAGQPLSGGLVYTYQPGTTTPLTTYTSSSLATANPNPLVLNSAGQTTTDMYTTQAFKLYVTDASNNLQWVEDNITTLGQLVSVQSQTTTYTSVVTDRDKLFTCNANGGSFTINLLASATAGNGFNLKFKKTDSSINTITIQANASELIDGTNTFVLFNLNDYVEMYNDGTQWWTVRAVPQTLRDSNGNNILGLVTTTSAVDYLTLADSATTLPPTIGVSGTDTNIGIAITPKGTGNITINGPTLITGATTLTGTAAILGTASAGAALLLEEDTTNGTNNITIQAPASLAANRTITLYDSNISTALVQQVRGTIAVASGTTTMPLTSVPTTSNGTQVATLSITPQNVNNILEVKVILPTVGTGSATVGVIAALFVSTSTNAVRAAASFTSSTAQSGNIQLYYSQTAGTTSSLTFSVYMGAGAAATWYLGQTTTINFGGGVIGNGYIEISEYVN